MPLLVKSNRDSDRNDEILLIFQIILIIQSDRKQKSSLGIIGIILLKRYYYLNTSPIIVYMGNQVKKNTTQLKANSQENQLSSEYEEAECFDNEVGFQNSKPTPAFDKVKIFPYNCIGIIFFKRNGAPGHATGMLIGPNLVLTAAHNICEVRRQQKKYYTNLVFFAGLSGPSKKTNERDGIKIKDYRIPALYDPKKIDYDYALLQLEKKIDRREYIKLGVDYQYLNQQICNISYHQDDVNHDEKSAIQKQTRGLNQPSLQNVTLNHKLSTSFGCSGSPILVKRQNQFVAIAIHKGSAKSQNLQLISAQNRKNCARLINEDVLKCILKWEKELYLNDFKSKIAFTHMKASPTINNSQTGIKAFQQFMQQFKKKIIQAQLTATQMMKKNHKLALQNLNLKQYLNIQKHKNKTLLQEINKYNQLSLLERQKSEIKLKDQTIIQQTNPRQTNISSIRLSNLNQSSHYLNDSSIQSTCVKNDKTLKKIYKKIDYWDKSTRFSCRYNISNRKIALTQEDNEKYQLTSMKHLCNYSPVEFKLLKYGGGRRICFGVITEERKKYQYSGQHAESVGLWSCPQKKVGWRKCIQLTDRFKDKLIYSFVVLSNRNDEIQFIQ